MYDKGNANCGCNRDCKSLPGNNDRELVGNPKDPRNPLGWDKVVLNLPGMKSFDPTMPRVYKWSNVKGGIAEDFIAFVDDVRAVGINQLKCTLIISR